MVLGEGAAIMKRFPPPLWSQAGRGLGWNALLLPDPHSASLKGEDIPASFAGQLQFLPQPVPSTPTPETNPHLSQFYFQRLVDRLGVSSNPWGKETMAGKSQPPTYCGSPAGSQEFLEKALC